MKVAPNPLNQQGFAMIAGLIIQYILGMTTNMFVKFPDSGNEGVMWEAAKKQPIFLLHMIWGTLLLIAALIFYIRALKRKDKTWKIAAGLGFAFILFAALGGSTFVGNQQDVYSMVMALSFLAALLSYGWGLYASRG